MASSFRAYIDEAGDDGFFFKDDGAGSSTWMILSAVVIRTKDDLQVVRALEEVRILFEMVPNFSLHFRKLSHAQRKAYVSRIALIPAKLVSIVAFKRKPIQPNPFLAEKHLFYRYLIRLLLERVSWICRDDRIAGEGDGMAELTFSDKSSMSYDNVREYLDRLRSKSHVPSHGINIHWAAIDSQNVTSVAHSKLAGLQVADAVASSIFQAVTVTKYGQTETAYANPLVPRFYRYRDAKLWGYGVKTWPESIEKLSETNPNLKELLAWK